MTHVLKIFKKPGNHLRRLTLWISKSKDDQSEEFRRLYIFVLIIASTGLLMWSYTFNSWFGIRENAMGIWIMSFLYSSFHLLSPLFYRMGLSLTKAAYLGIGAGFSFQFHHALVTGGFHSDTVIWFSVLPMIIGIVLNVHHMLIWLFVSLSGVSALFVLTQWGFTTTYITPLGLIWSELNIAGGYVVLNVVLMLAYFNYRDQVNQTLEQKERKIHGLLRMVVHDISNPLTLISYANDKLKDSVGDDNRVKDHVARIERGTDCINRIIHLAHTFEILNTKHKGLKLSYLNLSDIVLESLELMIPRLENKEIELELDLPEQLVVQAEHDLLINQVFNNLFSNCIKFTPRKGTIRISALQGTRGPVLSIKDSGIGIEHKRLATLFDEAESDSTLGTEGERGSGLGMPIVKLIMQKFQGDIEVKSSTSPGSSGTEFLLTFKV